MLRTFRMSSILLLLNLGFTALHAPHTVTINVTIGFKANAKREIASLTKIMTAICTL